MKVRVYVTLKTGILDPQGEAVQRSLHHLGYTTIKNVRLGKYIEIELSPMPLEEAKKQMAEMGQKLLANTVIEDFRFEVDGPASGSEREGEAPSGFAGGGGDASPHDKKRSDHA